MHSDAFLSERNEYMRIPSETNDALTLFIFLLFFLFLYPFIFLRSDVCFISTVFGGIKKM